MAFPARAIHRVQISRIGDQSLMGGLFLIGLGIAFVAANACDSMRRIHHVLIVVALHAFSRIPARRGLREGRDMAPPSRIERIPNGIFRRNLWFQLRLPKAMTGVYQEMPQGKQNQNNEAPATEAVFTDFRF
jgi:hypothetical protein